MNFSQRYGYKPVSDLIQIESMDQQLRNSLWNLLTIYCWEDVYSTSGYGGGSFLSDPYNKDLSLLCRSLWLHYFKKPLDTLDNDWRSTKKDIRRYFFECKWNEVYDFVEFVVGYHSGQSIISSMMKDLNTLLEIEKSAYRLVDNVITRVVEKHEINEIEEAIASQHSPVANHIRRSLELMSDRKNPDYRNSIKESISAVESAVALSTGSDSGTLGQLLKKLEAAIGLHPALKGAFSKLYGYTSDEEGIRHAILERNNLDFHDAKFMLVVCSAFTNFIDGKLRGAT